MKTLQIIIAGAGEVGTDLTRRLSIERHNLIVIDTDEAKLNYIQSHYDTLTITGSAISPEILNEAKVQNADIFIAVTPTEELNIVSCQLAKYIGAEKTIARIDNKEYLQNRFKEQFQKLGIDSLIYPEMLAARQITTLLRQANTSEQFDFSGGKLSLMAIKLNHTAAIIGKTLKETTSIDSGNNYRAVAITRESETIIPRGNDVFQNKDLVHVITNQQGVPNLMKYSGKKHYIIKNIMILGGSRIGSRIARELQGSFNIKLIEQDKEKSFKLASDLEKTTIINEDGTNLEILREAGIQSMDAFIAVTENSETNILACMLAKKMGVRKTIAEIENNDYIDFVKRFDIDAIINKKIIAASHIYRYTMNAEIGVLYCLNGMDAEVLEFVAQPNSKITKKKLSKIKFPKTAIIGGVVRGQTSFVATGETEIKAFDKVVVFSLPESLSEVEGYFI